MYRAGIGSCTGVVLAMYQTGICYVPNEYCTMYRSGTAKNVCTEGGIILYRTGHACTEVVPPMYLKEHVPKRPLPLRAPTCGKITMTSFSVKAKT